jgi:hypothetical protein
MDTITLFRPVGPKELKLIEELWIPAEELEEFNNHIIDIIEVTKEFFLKE